MPVSCPGEKSHNIDISYFNDLMSYYKTKYKQLNTQKRKRLGFGNRTLSKNREYQIATDMYLRDQAYIDRLKITLIYLLICIALVMLVYVSILPQKFGYVLIGIVIVAYILTVFFVNNNFHKRYNLDYSRYEYNPNFTPEEADDAGPCCGHGSKHNVLECNNNNNGNNSNGNNSNGNNNNLEMDARNYYREWLISQGDDLQGTPQTPTDEMMEQFYEYLKSQNRNDLLAYVKAQN